MTFSRRKFLRNSSVIAATGAVGFPHISKSADKLHATTGQKPKHIIHLVSDGMSMGTLTCADYLSQIVRGRPLVWMDLYKHPAVATSWMNMRSLNSLVTDSSAASSSWGCGARIINGMVNMAGDERPLKTLYELFGEIGWKRGLVTTTEITHATPAGFVACVNSRDKASTIAAQYLDRKVDLLLGGGAKFFDAKARRDKRDLFGDFQKAGYHLMDSRDQLASAPLDKPWLGTFGKSHLPFTVDHKHIAKHREKVPTLAEMTEAALKHLSQAPHFILQVEGGRVDHGCHNCDAAGALYDQIAFDEAIEVCLDFQKRVPDTLLVITTDHGNANLGLNGSGSAYGQSTWQFRNLVNAKASFSEMLKALKRNPPDEGKVEETEEEKKEREKKMSKEEKAAADKRKKIEDEEVATPTEIIDIIQAATGYKVPYDKAETLIPHLAKRGKAMYDLMKEDVCALGQLMANHWAIGWTGNAHTGDYVPVTALGPGAEKFRGFIQNTEIFDHYLSFANIEFRNPQEPLITAGADAHEVEDAASYKYAV
jgi:alkaline phosphatase